MGYCGREKKMQTRKLVLLAIAMVMFLGAVKSAQAAVTWLNPNDPNPADPTRDYFYTGGQTDNQLFVAAGTNPLLAPSSIVFTPTNFIAQASNGNAAITSDRVQFDLHIKPGKELKGFEVDELGDYQIAGAGPNTFVKATGFLQLINLDALPTFLQDTLDTSPAALSTTGLFANTPQPGDPSGILWFGTDQIVNIPQGWMNIRVIINNVLQANSNVGTSAQIQKKFTTGGVTIDLIVPEPATIGLLGFGALLLVRRRNANV
jgi:hypothetical protein